jgi:hypothetical protein
MAHVSEAAFYVLVWRARSSRLPFWRFLGFVIAFSVTDQLAYGLAAPFKDGGAPAWRVALAGLHLAAGTPFHDSPAIRAAFGSIGLLTALRIGLTAIPQARAAGRRLIGPLILTALVWLLTRIAAWWAFDLIRGMSPVGGG